jgi:hypothetical protein
VPKLPSIAAWFLDSLLLSLEDSSDNNNIKGIVCEQERLAPIHYKCLVEVKLALVSLAVDTHMRLLVVSYTWLNYISNLSHREDSSTVAPQLLDYVKQNCCLLDTRLARLQLD